MVGRARAGGVPEELALRLVDRDVVDRSVAVGHQTILVELPVLVAVRAEPPSAGVVVLVREAHGDDVVRVRPDLLDEAVVELSLPLVGEERHDRGAALHECRAVAPPAVLAVGEGDPLGIAGVPRVLGGSGLDGGGLGGERGERWSGHGEFLRSIVPFDTGCTDRCSVYQKVQTLGCSCQPRLSSVARCRPQALASSAWTVPRSSPQQQPPMPPASPSPAGTTLRPEREPSRSRRAMPWPTMLPGMPLVDGPTNPPAPPTAPRGGAVGLAPDGYPSRCQPRRPGPLRVVDRRCPRAGWCPSPRERAAVHRRARRPCRRRRSARPEARRSRECCGAPDGASVHGPRRGHGLTGGRPRRRVPAAGTGRALTVWTAPTLTRAFVDRSKRSDDRMTD